MKFGAGCSRSQAIVLVIGISWFSACGMGSSERVVGVCLPVVEYSQAEQALAAKELTLQPDGSAIVEMMGDYAVMREQAHVCL